MRRIDSTRSRSKAGPLANGLACLEAFTAKPGGLNLSEISRQLKLDPATASRLCATLVALRFLQRDKHKRYNLTPRVLSLGYSYLSSLPSSPYVEHCLVELFAQINEPISLGILDGADVVYLWRIPKREFLPFDLRPGARLPAYCTALGKAILAYSSPELVTSTLQATLFVPRTEKTITSADRFIDALRMVRTLGYACNDEELHAGSRAVAAPILDQGGMAVAAISVPLPVSQYSTDEIRERFAPQIIKTSTAIGFALQVVEDPFHLSYLPEPVVRSE